MLYNISYYLRFSTVLCYCSFPLSCALWPERGIVAKAVVALIYVKAYLLLKKVHRYKAKGIQVRILSPVERHKEIIRAS